MSFPIKPLYIDGVEVTQAIQYYHAKEHLTDPADRGEDNSIRLIANKPAWVRVYVRSSLLTSISGVTGTLEVQQRRWGFLYETVYTHSAESPGTVIAETHPNYADEILDSGRHAKRMIWMMVTRYASSRKSSVKRHIQNIHKWQC
jgi:hypothetical protein